MIGTSVMIELRIHCGKSVRIRSYSGVYSVRMRKNTDQNNAEYGHFHAVKLTWKTDPRIKLKCQRKMKIDTWVAVTLNQLFIKAC